MRVLLAEDNATNQKIASRFPEREGHQVTLASDGRQALAAHDRENFDVVLMDVQMPEMDGFQATAAIRARERDTGKRLPMQRGRPRNAGRPGALPGRGDGQLHREPIRARELIELLEKFSDAAQEEASPA